MGGTKGALDPIQEYSRRMYGIPADMGQMRAKYVDWATYDRMEVSYTWLKAEQWAY